MGQRLKRLRENLEDDAGNKAYPNKKDFAVAAGESPSNYYHYESGRQEFNPEKAEIFGKLLEVSAAYLLTGKRSIEEETGIKRPEFENVPIAGCVGAGVFQEVEVRDDGEYEYVSVDPETRFPGKKRFALRVKGESMNRIVKDGGLITCVPFDPFKDEMEDGILYVVEFHHADGTVEATLKELRLVDDKAYLWPRSNHKDHQLPVELKGNDGDEIKLKARVVSIHSAW